MTRKLITILILFCLTLFAPPVTFAESATPSAEEIEQSLQDRIKKAIQDNLPTVKQNIDQKTAASSTRAFVGTIESISGKTITIKTTSGIKQAIVTDDTNILNQGKSAKLTDLPISNGIIAIGTTSDFTTQTSKRIVVYNSSQPETRRVLTATVVSLSTTKKTIILDSNLTSQKDTIDISSRAQLYTSSLQPLSLDKITNGLKAIVVLHQTDTDYVLTRLILTSPLPDKTASKCGDKVCSSDESPETCPKDCQP